MGTLADIFLQLKGASGAYNPAFNQIILPEKPTKEQSIGELYDQMERGNWYTNRHMWGPEGWKSIIEQDQLGYNDTAAHEKEHKRQFNQPGSYFSKRDRDIWRDSPHWKDRKNSGYSDVNVPLELMADMVGGQSMETGSISQQPPYNWSKLTDEQKLWLLSNRDRYLTDQKYLDNVQGAGFGQRIKHLGESLTGSLMSLFE